MLRWPGRFDVVSRRPLVILDCAHNELSIGALLETIAVELGPQVRPRLIFGCLEDKQWAKMAAMLAPRVRDVTLDTGTAQASARARESVAAVFRAGSRARGARAAARGGTGDGREWTGRRYRGNRLRVSGGRDISILPQAAGSAGAIS